MLLKESIDCRRHGKVIEEEYLSLRTATLRII